MTLTAQYDLDVDGTGCNGRIDFMDTAWQFIPQSCGGGAQTVNLIPGSAYNVPPWGSVGPVANIVSKAGIDGLSINNTGTGASTRVVSIGNLNLVHLCTYDVKFTYYCTGASNGDCDATPKAGTTTVTDVLFGAPAFHAHPPCSLSLPGSQMRTARRRRAW